MIFVDTSFLVAGLNPQDAHHSDAVALKPKLEGRRMVCTNHVVGETWTLTNRRYGHRAAVAIVNGLRDSARYEVVHVDERTEADAFAWLARHDEREYSFVDATSFGVMRARGIDDALAFDRDFEAAGFRTLRA